MMYSFHKEFQRYQKNEKNVKTINPVRRYVARYAEPSALQKNVYKS